MQDMFRGLGVGYGSGAAAGWAIFVACSCALVSLAVFWIGGAVAALSTVVLLWARRERRAPRDGDAAPLPGAYSRQ